MNIALVAEKAAARRAGRAGRRFKDPAAVARELDAAGKPAAAHKAFNYPAGAAVKRAADLLALLGLPAGGS